MFRFHWYGFDYTIWSLIDHRSDWNLYPQPGLPFIQLRSRLRIPTFLSSMLIKTFTRASSPVNIAVTIRTEYGGKATSECLRCLITQLTMLTRRAPEQ